MINLVNGNIIDADVEALVNTVNTVGVMGKGIALQFRQAFPENYQAYRKACNRGEVQIGHMFVFATGTLTNPRYIINFPTKRHWKNKSRLEDIEAGLHDLVAVIQEKEIGSIAIPPLGCGNGGLIWDEVRPRIESALAGIADLKVLLYAPEGTPQAQTMAVATKRPAMTPGRAALLALMDLYLIPDYRLTRLEIQKLAYFLQQAGEPLRLNFIKHKYGPYAENLNHVLQRMEGHFIRGYGDRSQNSSIEVLPPADQEAETFLQHHLETQQRLRRVACLIEGFETPHSMELLSTVHWVVQENLAIKDDVSLVVKAVHAWNARKSHFRPDHIEIAWERLCQERWIHPSSPPS